MQVLTLSQILRFDADASITERMRLERLAALALTYKFAEGTEVDDALQYYAGPEYKVLLTMYRCSCEVWDLMRWSGATLQSMQDSCAHAPDHSVQDTSRLSQIKIYAHVDVHIWLPKADISPTANCRSMCYARCLQISSSRPS